MSVKRGSTWSVEVGCSSSEAGERQFDNRRAGLKL